MSTPKRYARPHAGNGRRQSTVTVNGHYLAGEVVGRTFAVRAALMHALNRQLDLMYLLSSLPQIKCYIASCSSLSTVGVLDQVDAQIPLHPGVQEACWHCCRTGAEPNHLSYRAESILLVPTLISLATCSSSLDGMPARYHAKGR